MYSAPDPNLVPATMVVRQGLTLVLIGLAVGVAGALAAGLDPLIALRAE